MYCIHTLKMIEFEESSRLTMSNTHIKTVRPDFIFSLFRNSPTWSMSTKIMANLEAFCQTI